MKNNIEILPVEPPYSLLWDECALISDKCQDLIDSGIAKDPSEAFEMASLDHEMLEFEFEDFLETFDDILKKISSSGKLRIEGRNMGWRHLSGSLDLVAPDARSFISKAFPRTSEWTLRGIYDGKAKSLRFTLSHHDAPTGEQYIVTKMLCA